ncbi:MAG TPA: S9 family peptidase, partial [Candidatus Limnocylindria bacterium]|nr:S9 family peptidase [Candidatus Limnocylindria bacterium]
MTSRKARIPLEELCRLPSFFFPLVSWKGDRVGFYWDRSGRIELYVMDLATKAVRQVSHGEVPRAMRTGFAWSRDDRFIAFGKDAGGNEQHDLYKIEVESGKVARLTDDPAAEEHAIQFSPDDRWLTVGTNRRLPETPDRAGQLNLWKIRPDGSDYTPLTRYAFPVFGGLWSDDGKWISYVTNEDPSNLKNRDGYVVAPDGTGARKVFSVRAGSQDTLGEWHGDGRRVAATSDA